MCLPPCPTLAAAVIFCCPNLTCLQLRSWQQIMKCPTCVWEGNKNEVFLSGPKHPSFVFSEIWLLLNALETKQNKKTVKEMVGFHSYQNLQTKLERINKKE